MPRSLQDVLKIARTGASLALDAREYSFADLVEIAAVYPTIPDPETRLGLNFLKHLDAAQLEAISQASGGKVMFSGFDHPKKPN